MDHIVLTLHTETELDDINWQRTLITSLFSQVEFLKGEIHEKNSTIKCVLEFIRTKHGHVNLNDLNFINVSNVVHISSVDESVFGNDVNACNYPILSNLNEHRPNIKDRVIRDTEINDEFTTTLNSDDKRNKLCLNTNKVAHELEGPNFNFNSDNLNSRLNVVEDIQLNIRNDLVHNENIAMAQIKNTKDRQLRSNVINDEHVTRRHQSRKENLQLRSNIFINPYPEHDQLLTERPGRQHYNEVVKNGYCNFH